MTVQSLLWKVLLANVLVVAAGAVHYAVSDVNWFKEGALLTFWSFVQLIVVYRLCIKSFKIRRGTQKTQWKDPIRIWAIIAYGFLFLALDEVFQAHENLDTLIHRIFSMQQTSISARIDDFIVGLWGLMGLGVLYYYRTELKQYNRCIPYLIIAFILLFVMVGLDILTHKADILMLIYDYDSAKLIRDWLGKAEEGIKVIAEGFYIVAFYAVLQEAKSMGSVSPASAA